MEIRAVMRVVSNGGQTATTRLPASLEIHNWVEPPIVGPKSDARHRNSREARSRCRMGPSGPHRVRPRTASAACRPRSHRDRNGRPDEGRQPIQTARRGPDSHLEMMEPFAPRRACTRPAVASIAALPPSCKRLQASVHPGHGHGANHLVPRRRHGRGRRRFGAGGPHRARLNTRPRCGGSRSVPTIDCICSSIHRIRKEAQMWGEPFVDGIAS